MKKNKYYKCPNCQKEWFPEDYDNNDSQCCDNCVTKIVSYFKCDVCHKEYAKEEHCMECEKKHIGEKHVR